MNQQDGSLEDYNSYHQRKLREVAERGDITGLISALVHDVNAYRTRIDQNLFMITYEHPLLIDHPLLESIRISTKDLQDLVWFYFELIASSGKSPIRNDDED